MYAGAGPGPMMAAAAAWDYLAAELASSAASYSSVTAELTSSSWFGPASRSMLEAATPYISWLSAAAALAEQTSDQAKAVASAFDAAFAMTVPPAAIAENRAQLLMLIATNFLGQNTPAIAATEAGYAEMWAQDAAAMNGYAGFVATSSQLAPFSEPTQTTDQTGLAQQQAAVAAAAAEAAGTDAPTATQTSLNDIINMLSSQIKGLLFGPLDVIYWPMIYVGSLIFQQIGALWPEHLAAGAAVGFSATPALAAPVHLGGGLISANLASSTKIGALSVPTSWSATAPKAAAEPIVAASGIGGVGGPSNGPESLLRQIVPARGRRGRGGLPPREYGFRPRFTARPPSAG
ncbi:PPE family protein [Mycobacterium florentinum]|nr:PPE family protein [Mycobacterium florentinum]